MSNIYLMVNVTVSSKTVCVTNFDSFFSSMPFLCNVAIKSVNGRDIRNCSSIIRPANINGPCLKYTIEKKQQIIGEFVRKLNRILLDV